jgi:hypothetical protein
MLLATYRSPMNNPSRTGGMALVVVLAVLH